MSPSQPARNIKALLKKYESTIGSSRDSDRLHEFLSGLHQITIGLGSIDADFGLYSKSFARIAPLFRERIRLASTGYLCHDEKTFLRVFADRLATIAKAAFKALLYTKNVHDSNAAHRIPDIVDFSLWIISLTSDESEKEILGKEQVKKWSLVVMDGLQLLHMKAEDSEDSRKWQDYNGTLIRAMDSYMLSKGKGIGWLFGQCGSGDRQTEVTAHLSLLWLTSELSELHEAIATKNFGRIGKVLEDGLAEKLHEYCHFSDQLGEKKGVSGTDGIFASILEKVRDSLAGDLSKEAASDIVEARIAIASICAQVQNLIAEGRGGMPLVRMSRDSLDRSVAEIRTEIKKVDRFSKKGIVSAKSGIAISKMVFPYIPYLQALVFFMDLVRNIDTNIIQAGKELADGGKRQRIRELLRCIDSENKCLDGKLDDLEDELKRLPGVYLELVDNVKNPATRARDLLRKADDRWESLESLVEQARLRVVSVFLKSLGRENKFLHGNVLMHILARSSEEARLNSASIELLERLIEIEGAQDLHVGRIERHIIELSKEEQIINSITGPSDKKIESMHRSVDLLRKLQDLYRTSLPRVIWVATVPILDQRIRKFQRRIDRFREIIVLEREDLAMETARRQSSQAPVFSDDMLESEMRVLGIGIGPEASMLSRISDSADDIEEDRQIACSWIHNRYMLSEIVELNEEAIKRLGRRLRFDGLRATIQRFSMRILKWILRSWGLCVILPYLLVFILKSSLSLAGLEAVQSGVESVAFMGILLLFWLHLLLTYLSRFETIRVPMKQILLPQMIVPALLFISQNIQTDEAWAIGFQGSLTAKAILMIAYLAVGFHIIRYGLLGDYRPATCDERSSSDADRRLVAEQRVNKTLDRRAWEIMSVGLWQAFVLVSFLSVLPLQVMAGRLSNETSTLLETGVHSASFLPANYIQLDIGVAKLGMMPWLVLYWTVQVFFFGAVLGHLFRRARR